jgi:hypothetical protein
MKDYFIIIIIILKLLIKEFFLNSKSILYEVLSIIIGIKSMIYTTDFRTLSKINSWPDTK